MRMKSWKTSNNKELSRMKINLSQPKRNETENSGKNKLRLLKMKNSPKNIPKLEVYSI
jgi:hypothetical protein